MRIGDPVLRINAVAALAPRLTPALRERLRGKANSLKPHAAVDILIAIVAGADGETKLDLIAAARAAADAVESESGTALAYLDIARHLDGQERAAALETALSRAFVVELAEEREPVVVDVLYELSDVDPERALALSEHLPEPARRRLVPYLITRLDAAAQDHVIRRLVATADERGRAQLVVSLLDQRVESWDGAVLSGLRDVALDLDDPVARAQALAAVMNVLPDAERSEIASDLRLLASNRHLPRPSRSYALEALIRYGSAQERIAALSTLLALQRGDQSTPATETFTSHSALFRGLPASAHDPVWRALLDVFATHARPRLLEAFADLASVIALGRPGLAVQLVEAIDDAVRWWP